MGATALVSGGKDSIYSAYLAETQGYPVDELVVIEPADPDSFLFHTPNLSLVALQAEAWGKRFRRVTVDGLGSDAEADAVARAIGTAGPVVVAGAIASSFQWSRLHSACWRAGRRLFTPLWDKEDRRVVQEEIGAGLDIRLVHLSAEPLGPSQLGTRLDGPRLEEFARLARTVRSFHLAGEGGEFETLVVDAPFFRRRIELRTTETESRGGAHRLVVREAALVDKSSPAPGRS